MNDDQFRSCIPSCLLMASELTCSAAKRDFQTALPNQVQAAFPLPKSSLHSYGSPIDSEHDDYLAELGFVL